MAASGVPSHARLLRRAREELGLTGQAVAARMGVSASAYRNAERGAYGNTVFAPETLAKAFSKERASELHEAWQAYKSTSTPTQRESLTTVPVELPVELLQGLAEARISRFHPSRKYYKLLREGRSSISSYVGQANRSLEMVSITLATGMELERVIDTFEKLIDRQDPVRITISLLNPGKKYLMECIAGVIGASPTSLEGRIEDTVTALREFRADRLAKRYREYLSVRLHNSIPNASVIVIDGDTANGLVQLETNGYKMAREKSFGFEVRSGSEFFNDLRDSYRHLMRDGDKLF